MSLILKLTALNLINLNFFLSGLNKIKNFTNTSKNFMKRLPIDLPIFVGYLAILCAILIQILSPVIINLGVIKKQKKLITIGISSLLIFTILATILYHIPPIGKNYYAFMSNLSLIGCFIYILFLNNKIS